MNKKAEKYLLQVVKNNYEEIAIDFNETRKKPMKPLVAEIVSQLNIKAGCRVLDLGCGNGRFVDVVGEDVEYFGIDGSQKLINFAVKKYGEKFKVFDILKLKELTEKNFDFIFSWAVVHHIPGRRLRNQFLKDIYEKLENGGIVVLSSWKLRKKKNFICLSAKSFLQNIFKGRIVDWGDLIFNWGKKSNGVRPRYYHAFSKRGFRAIAKNTGLKVKIFLEDNYNYYLILEK